MGGFRLSLPLHGLKEVTATFLGLSVVCNRERVAEAERQGEDYTLFVDTSSSHSVTEYLEPKDQICGTEYFGICVDL